MEEKQIDKLSPMMRQYYELKERCKDSILFFRLGDFYEVFAEDAVTIAPLLELTLTSRERGDSQRVKFCGVPHHSASSYWLKLLKCGFKVSIADQIEDAASAKGLVKREIVRSLSPGCIYDLEGLEQDSPNYLLAVYEAPDSKKVAVALADISTGELRLGSIPKLSELPDLVERLRPREIICRRFCRNQIAEILRPVAEQSPLAFSDLPEAILRDQTAQFDLLSSLFGKDFLAGAKEPLGIEGGQAILGGLLQYYQTLGASLGQFLRIKDLVEPKTMILDDIVIRDLELFETARTRRQRGSLFRLINQCQSPMGARLLRWSLSQPLLAKDEIMQRQEGVAGLLAEDESVLAGVRQLLHDISDLERLSTRVLLKNARPQELARMRNSLQAIQLLQARLTAIPSLCNLPIFADAVANLGLHANALDILSKALLDCPTILGSGMEVFRPGFDATLDQQVNLAQNSEQAVESYLDKLKAKTGIGSLKIRKHKNFGLLIEVTKTHLGKIPEFFIRRQTMVNGERYVTVELQELDDALKAASEVSVAREASLYDDLLHTLACELQAIRTVSDAVATIDFIQSLAFLAQSYSYCRPLTSDEGGDLNLMGARHPVVEHFVGRKNFVPNNVTLSHRSRQMLITGPNMAGKSTAMRLTAICAILHQIGSYVPCQSAELPIFDRIFTRVGAFDDLSQGLSTFMVEMKESAHILRTATQQSLVILDEVGRGTSTQDGLAIASAILEYMHKDLGCWLMFATHYHELVPLARQLGDIAVMQIKVIENQGMISFSHLLVPGACGSSFGLEVASLAGVPEAILRRARNFLSQGVEPAPLESSRKAVSTPLFSEERPGLDELARRIEQVKINRMTPLQALNLLDDLKNFLLRPQSPGLFEDRQNLS